MKQAFSFILFLLITLVIAAQNESSKDSTEIDASIHTISALTKKAETDKYGLTPEMPVKVGKGPKGGPANQRAYLDLLRDPQGEPLEYERVGSCCAYASKNGFMGYAMVDRYEIKYKNEKNKNKKTIVYISFYDYEEPLILVGFQTVPQD